MTLFQVTAFYFNTIFGPLSVSHSLVPVFLEYVIHMQTEIYTLYTYWLSSDCICLQSQILETFPFLKVQNPLGSLTIFPATNILILRCTPKCLGTESKCNLLPNEGEGTVVNMVVCTSIFQFQLNFGLLHSYIKMYLWVGYHVIYWHTCALQYLNPSFS